MPGGGRIAFLKEAVRVRPFWEGDIWTNWRWQGTRLWEGKAVKNKIGAKALRQEHTCVLKKEWGTWCRWGGQRLHTDPSEPTGRFSFLLWLRGDWPTTYNLSPTHGCFFLWMSYLPHHPIILVSRNFFKSKFYLIRPQLLKSD